jgi:hypothetical protein
MCRGRRYIYYTYGYLVVNGVFELLLDVCERDLFRAQSFWPLDNFIFIQAYFLTRDLFSFEHDRRRVYKNKFLNSFVGKNFSLLLENFNSYLIENV